MRTIQLLLPMVCAVDLPILIKEESGNKDLREAVIQAVDEKTMCETTVGGPYTYGFSVLPSNLAYNYDKLSNPFEYNQEEAKAKLDAAGIVDSDGDGIRELDEVLQWC